MTNTGSTIINGDLGVWPGLAITGFPPGIVVPPGAAHAGDAVAQQAQSDLTVVYNTLADQPCHTNLTGLDLGGLTLTSGIYCFNSSAQLTGQLTLDLQGDADAIFIFQIGSTLTTAPGSSIIFVNGASSCNVFWQVGSSATLDTSTRFAGNIVALTSITLNTNANITGRLLARNGAVTLDSNNITRCAEPVAATDTPLPATETAIALTPTNTPTNTPPAPTLTAIAATQTALAPTLTAIAMTPTPTLPAGTATALAAQQTVIAATAAAIAPTLTVLAMTPPPTNLDENSQPQMPNNVYIQWLAH